MILCNLIEFAKRFGSWLPGAFVTVLGLTKGSMETTLLGVSVLVIMYELFKMDKKISNSCWY